MIRAVTDADLGEESVARNDDRLKHGVDLPLKLWGPPASRIGGVEIGLEVESRVEGGVLAGLEPGLAHEHGTAPSVLQGEPGEDVGEAPLGQVGPVGSKFGPGSRLDLSSSLIVHRVTIVGLTVISLRSAFSYGTSTCG